MRNLINATFYQNSISSVYSAQVGEACKNNIKNYIKEFLNTDKVKFIFSNNKGVSIDKVKFCEGGIYDTLPIHKNIYTQLHIKESEKPYYSNKFTLPPKFILIQRAIRNDTTFKGKIIRLYRNKDTNNEEKIINLLKDTYPLIFLDFKTDKKSDSFSTFNGVKETIIKCDNLKDQIYLISKSTHCVFFSEGEII